ncbi:MULTISPECIES: LysR family transcriptional regulator [Tepidiphilus]|uniref:LysR family transcriptional regulator n=1 Tax=Tepidiphilus baoligensis TaxID=2698687 RepID=A0ABX1QLH4_9PROT|nr:MULTISPECIES: LysR family transcriptional regulator [Tepidiphilus]NMH15925.1 LysR family transcriptional regulator [Tepidiphilus baoligensis]
MADRRLQVFYTVVKAGSFTKAAERLFMTQPAVTFQIKQLEEHFNTRLLERGHGKLKLTPAGEIVFAYAEKMLSLDEELETRVAELTSELSGLLCVGASTTLATWWMPRVIEEFKRAHPRVIPRLVVGTSQLTQQRVLERDLDLGFIEIATKEPGLEQEEIGRDELWAIFAPNHPLAKGKGKPVRAEQLAKHPFIQRDPGNGIREIAEAFFAASGISPESLEIAAEIGTLQGVKHLAAAGIGVAIASRAALLEELRTGQLAAAPLDPPQYTPFELILPKDRFRSRLIMTFADFARERIQTMERQLPSAEFFFGR